MDKAPVLQALGDGFLAHDRTGHGAGFFGEGGRRGHEAAEGGEEQQARHIYVLHKAVRHDGI